ncbi:hypothetical protein ACTVBU_03105, partial [Sanguibacter sp. A246]
MHRDLPDDVLALLGVLRRRPDVEAPELVAVDAADRLVLAESRTLLASAGPGEVAVLDDGYGALTLGALALGAPDVRVATDTVTSKRAILLNAAAVATISGIDVSQVRVLPALDPAVVAGARIVLARLPRSLDALAELADLVADQAAPDVVLLATGRLKHMSRSMNDVLAVRFGEVSATLAHGKARALIARRPMAAALGYEPFPRRARISVPYGNQGDLGGDGAGGGDAAGDRGRGGVPGGGGTGGDRAGGGRAGGGRAGGGRAGGGAPGSAGTAGDRAGGLEVVAHGAAFAGPNLDIGTRALLDALDELLDEHRDGVSRRPGGGGGGGRGGENTHE